MGIITKMYRWIVNPLRDNSRPMEWFAALVLLLILSFLWSTVVKQIVEV